MYPLPFDLLNDFEPVSMLSIGPLWIMGSADRIAILGGTAAQLLGIKA
jgi:hypothetical protein